MKAPVHKTKKSLTLFSSRLECLPYKKGYVKVKLFFTTDEPTHIRSHILKNTYGFKGPYLEDICILLPQAKVHPENPSFILPAFLRLQVLGIIPVTQLKEISILDEDELTLSYVLDL